MGKHEDEVAKRNALEKVLRQKDSVTYTAYNFAGVEKTVIFSDGYEMRAAPHQLTTQTVPKNKTK